MRARFLLLVSTIFLLVGVSAPSRADDWHWHNDINHFHEYDYDYWRGGYWYHGVHEGRAAWWWVVGGGYYYYPQPIYPYPDPYTPPAVIVAPVSPPPVVVGPPAAYYYCPRPAGYYPYIAQCLVPWQRVVGAGQAIIVQQQPPVVSEAPQPEPFSTQVYEARPKLTQREMDDRKLNALAVEFQEIDQKDPAAPFELKSLGKRISAFRQGLYQRSYNAIDIMHDAEGLEHRVAEAREHLTRHKPPVNAAPEPSTVPPVPLPLPGSESPVAR